TTLSRSGAAADRRARARSATRTAAPGRRAGRAGAAGTRPPRPPSPQRTRGGAAAGRPAAQRDHAVRPDRPRRAARGAQPAARRARAGARAPRAHAELLMFAFRAMNTEVSLLLPGGGDDRLAAAV